VSGGPEAGELLASVYGRVYDLAVRMLLDPDEAEDAAQDIAVKLLRGLPSFRGESSFATWALAVASNHLLALASRRRIPGLSFEAYEGEKGALPDPRGAELSEGERSLLGEELKFACTLGMLQCLDPVDRLAYVLHCFFGLSSEEGGAAAGLSAEAFRQRLSRTRRRMADFLKATCGLGGGECSCGPRVGLALERGRICRGRPYSRRALAAARATDAGVPAEGARAEPGASDAVRLESFKGAMEELESEGALFRAQPSMLPEDVARRISLALEGRVSVPSRT
jgi:RNA polymerase sigma factor (sigma-70 family)